MCLRSWSKVDLIAFQTAVSAVDLFTDPPDTASESATQFIPVLLNILETLIPSKTKNVATQPPQPVFNADIVAPKRCRSLFN